MTSKGTETPDQIVARAQALVARSREGMAEARTLLRTVLAKATNPRGRGMVAQQLWECERALGQHAGYFSQAGQDAWLETRVFKGKRGGVFVEIGGHDGITGSNCLFFELMRGWSGLLIEASPVFHAQASALRRCPCLPVAVAAGEGEAEFLDVQAGYTQMGGLVETYDPSIRQQVEANPRHRSEVIRVPTRPLAAILDEQGLSEIDYVSLDVEGGELAVLSVFPFERYRISAWTIENNRGSREIPDLMQSKGFRRVEALGVDDVYLHTSVLA